MYWRYEDLYIYIKYIYNLKSRVALWQSYFYQKMAEDVVVPFKNIYKILLNFSELFDIMDEDEQKNLLTYLIKEIQLNPHWENKSPLKWIEFNFPIYRNGEEVRKFLCEENPNVETLVVLSKKTTVQSF